MKRFIALGTVLVMLLFSFVTPANYSRAFDFGGVVDNKDDLPLPVNPYD